MNTLNLPTSITAMIAFPDVVQELKPLANREQIRWAIGECGNQKPITTPYRTGIYKLFTSSQVETLAEAKKQLQLLLINQELLGHSYTQEITIALKVEKTELEIRQIAQAIKYSITYATRHDDAKSQYRCDIHPNKKNHIDWHYTFSTNHNWQEIKRYIRQTLAKKFNLTARQVEIETKPYADDGWLDYILRVKKSGYHGDRPVKDYYHNKRVLFTKECKLRRYTHTSKFYVIGLEATNKIRIERNQQIKDKHNEQYLLDKPELRQAINAHSQQIIEWAMDDWRDDKKPTMVELVRKYAGECRYKKIETAQQFNDYLYAPPDEQPQPQPQPQPTELIEVEPFNFNEWLNNAP